MLLNNKPRYSSWEYGEDGAFIIERDNAGQPARLVKFCREHADERYFIQDVLGQEGIVRANTWQGSIDEDGLFVFFAQSACGGAPDVADLTKLGAWVSEQDVRLTYSPREDRFPDELWDDEEVGE
jgi:hypothetical protein